jgi:predicted pyridoxine 5'-phosphate oxidase superfamily flavin-nucleotide-binding protein
MGDKYFDIAFTDGVKSVQRRMSSRSLYQRFEGGPESNDRLGRSEIAFISARDSFYIASVSETGWPYVQFRGGPPGFLRVLDERTLGFADFRGNRQYVTAGNVTTNDRVSLFLMDYPNKRRLKIFGRIRTLPIDEDASLKRHITMPEYGGLVERAILIGVEAFNWNCPQHITPRYTAAECAALGKGPRPRRRAETCEPKDEPAG